MDSFYLNYSRIGSVKYRSKKTPMGFTCSNFLVQCLTDEIPPQAKGLWMEGKERDCKFLPSCSCLVYAKRIQTTQQRNKLPGSMSALKACLSTALHVCPGNMKNALQKRNVLRSPKATAPTQPLSETLKPLCFMTVVGVSPLSLFLRLTVKTTAPSDGHHKPQQETRRRDSHGSET